MEGVGILLWKYLLNKQEEKTQKHLMRLMSMLITKLTIKGERI